MLRRSHYPRQFWLLFAGMLVSTSGTSMVWPFLMIYMSGRLGLSNTAAASLMSINAGVALAAAFLAGTLVDRLGRKWTMAGSLVGFAGVYLLYGSVGSYAFAALLMGLSGLVNPVYRVGADAMMADLILPENRPSAYALMRMSSNLGISIGPVVGGFLAATSYNTVFLLAAGGLALFGVLVAVFARETKPDQEGKSRKEQGEREDRHGQLRRAGLGGYAKVFGDRGFMAFIAAFTLAQVCAALMWVLMPVHANHNFAVPENRYGWIPMTNAVMVVTLQALVTRFSRRHPTHSVLVVGSLLFGAAAASVALATGFSGFWISMVIMTLGELLLMPTSTTHTAALAPADMRGRYMSVYGLTWNIAQGLGPLTGGFLSDTVSPAAPWLMGGLAGLAAAVAFAVMRRKNAQPVREEKPRIFTDAFE